MSTRKQRDEARRRIRYAKSSGGQRGIEREGAKSRKSFWRTIRDAIASVFSDGKEPTHRELLEAERALHAEGVAPTVKPPPLPRRGDVKPPPLPRGRRQPQPPKPPRPPSTSAPAGDEGPEEHDIDTRTVITPGERHGADTSLTEEIEAPESSNVYSIQFDEFRGILYVRFKAESKRKPRPHVAGALYAYGGAGRSVPPVVWDRLKRGVSKGKAVWDHLRVRGTVWGHQYPYRLVDAPTGYVPRKATKRGFKTRRIPAVGRGARSTRRSTKPPRSF